MYRKFGVAAAGAAVSLAAVSGCAAAQNATKAAAHIVLSPMAAVQAAITAADNDNTVKINASISSTAMTMQMTGTEEFSPLKLSVTAAIKTASAGSINMSEIYDGTNFYMQYPALSALDGGKPWVEFNLSSMGSMGSSMQSLLDSAKNQSPTSTLESMVATGDVKSVGAETVDGQQTTHYTGTLTAGQLADLSAGQGLTAAQVTQIKQLLQQSGITSETIDVWIGSDNLPVEQKTVAETASGTVSTDEQFSDWGAPVSVQDPDPSQVGQLNLPGGSSLNS